MAMILEASIDIFMSFLEKLVQEEVAMLLGVEDEIESLQSKLQVLSIVVADAERKRMDNEAISGWIKKLKDVMYDADDILDLCRIEADKYAASETKPSESSRSKKWGCNNFGRLPCLPLPTCFRNPIFAHKIGKRIRTLNSRLSEISKEKDLYGFIPLTSSPRDEIMVISEISEKTDSTVESDIVGTKIKEDTRELVRSLTKPDDTENVLVFAIAGLGGIGKTTLAQLIFNDSMMKDFQLRVWLSVTKKFNENDLLKEVIREAGGDYGGAVSRNQLVNELVKRLAGKKFVIVLDDVWDAASVWENLLRNPLSKGAAGSRVLVTTRDEAVANMMRAVHCHRVDTLSKEDGWSLLCKKLVLRGNEREIEHLKDIGVKIVEKCGGLPLAVKAMGGALCGKSRGEWESVLRSNVWSISGFPEQVNRAIYWSYLQLPRHLKQCFLWWFLLPKGCEGVIMMYEVVYLWIAEGFIKDQGALMEETGEQYYRELVRRSFLQPHPVVLDAHVMHDLLRSLAEFLTQDESLFVEGQERVSNEDGLKKLRRLSMEGGELRVGDILRSKGSLRTAILWKNESRHLNGLLEHLRFLRVLEIGNSKIEKLPDAVTCLAHLRYLGLGGTQITELPENIGDLKNLQALNLHECRELDRLPISVVFLKNLRYLNISGTSVEGIPAGLRRLTHLSCLSGYRLHCPEEAEGAPTITTSKWSTLEELGLLEKLRVLSLLNLEVASNSSEARSARLLKKSRLVDFRAECNYAWAYSASKVDIKRMEEIYEVLQPPTSLERLFLGGYPCSRLPVWVAATDLPNLTRLGLQRCKYCESLSSLGKLPNLVHLEIEGMRSIISIGPEFMGETGGGEDGEGKRPSASSVSFPKLERLLIKDMSRWEKWRWDRELCAMPRLQELQLLSCPELISLPEGLSCHATALRSLTIFRCSSLEGVGNCYSLQELQIDECARLERVSDLPALEQLWIGECPSLNVVENLSSSLQIMWYLDSQAKSLPAWLSETEKSPKPEVLLIFCFRALFNKMREMGGEEWPKILHINRVEVVDITFARSMQRVRYTREPPSFTQLEFPNQDT